MGANEDEDNKHAQPGGLADLRGVVAAIADEARAAGGQPGVIVHPVEDYKGRDDRAREALQRASLRELMFWRSGPR